MAILQNVKDLSAVLSTKTTGSEQGLGLSLCYDIIKAHGGELQGRN